MASSASTISVPGASSASLKPKSPKTGAPPFELNSEDQAYSDQVFVPENFSGDLLHIEPDSLGLGDDFQIIWALNPAKSYKSKS